MYEASDNLLTVGAIADLDSRNTQTRNSMGVPEANTRR